MSVYYAITALVLCGLLIAHIHANPLLVITIMVKNESGVICQTLQPYVDIGLDCFLIYDTGSTDRTPDIAQEFFNNNNISAGYIIEEPFIDFATSRNRALELTYQQFPHATFILMIDAEWYIHNVNQLLRFCHAHRYDTEPAYLLRLMYQDATMYTGRLIRCAARVQFMFPVHECLDHKASIRVPSDVYMVHRPTTEGSHKTTARWERDVALLQQAIAENPNDTRSLFYLAQTLGALNRLHEAYHYYTACVASGMDKKPDELVYLAHYRLGKTAEQLIRLDASHNWNTVLHHYLGAFSYNPHRAEPLIMIAQHYWDTQEVDLCFLFARHATELPYPPDNFCVEDEVYTYTRYNLLGASAGPIGQLALGKWAVHKALEQYPTAPHLLHNLAEYERLEKIKSTEAF